MPVTSFMALIGLVIFAAAMTLAAAYWLQLPMAVLGLVALGAALLLRARRGR